MSVLVCGGGGGLEHFFWFGRKFYNDFSHKNKSYPPKTHSSLDINTYSSIVLELLYYVYCWCLCVYTWTDTSSGVVKMFCVRCVGGDKIGQGLPP